MSKNRLHNEATTTIFDNIFVEPKSCLPSSIYSRMHQYFLLLNYFQQFTSTLLFSN